MRVARLTALHFPADEHLLLPVHITNHIFCGRHLQQAAHALQLRQLELFVLLFSARRAYQRQVKEEGQALTSEIMFRHSYVDTLQDITLPEDGHRWLSDNEIIMLRASSSQQCFMFLLFQTMNISSSVLPKLSQDYHGPRYSIKIKFNKLENYISSFLSSKLLKVIVDIISLCFKITSLNTKLYFHTNRIILQNLLKYCLNF